MGRLTLEMVSAIQNPAFDLNADGFVFRSDVNLWLEVAGDANISAPYLQGNITWDERVDNSDFTGVWNANRFSAQDGWCYGDVNADAIVDVSDALILLTNIYQSSGDVAGTGDGGKPLPSTMTRFIYDPANGRMFIDLESRLSAWVIPGPEALAVHAFDGFDLTNGVFSQASYFSAALQWFGTRVNLPGGAHGTQLLATCPTGLVESDFGIVEYDADRIVHALPGVLVTDVSVDTVQDGDANFDGLVDVSDFNSWNAHKFGDSASWGNGDFNHDGFVDSDFNIWNSNKFQNTGWDNNSVPEPDGSLYLLTCILLAARLGKNQPCSSSARIPSDPCGGYPREQLTF